jgi:hypothetical protein
MMLQSIDHGWLYLTEEKTYAIDTASEGIVCAFAEMPSMELS